MFHPLLQISWRLHTKKNWVSCDPFLPLQEQALEVNANHCNLSIKKVFKSIESRKLTENLKNAFCFTFERLRESSASARIKGTSRDVISSRRVAFESRSTVTCISFALLLCHSPHFLRLCKYMDKETKRLKQRVLYSGIFFFFTVYCLFSF